jgi:general secretion pathway protein L
VSLKRLSIKVSSLKLIFTKKNILNKLYLRIPANLAAEWPNGSLAYALCSKDGAILREGQATLTELSKDIFKSKIVLIIAASDVTLLDIVIPAIPEAKLKLALPNLVEDQLISDSSECVLLLVAKGNNSEADAHSDSDGGGNKRVVAVAQRSWLQQLSASLYALGASYVKALPAQLCIPYQNGHCSVLMEEFGEDSSVHYSLRFDVNRGIGVLLESEQSVEKRLATISELSPSAPIVLLLPNVLVDAYKTAIAANPTWAERITVQESNWSSTINEAKTVGVNLLSGLGSGQTSHIQWRIWRWALILGALTLLVNLVGLNVEYWSLKREVQALKMGMAQTYKASFPKDAVVPYPLEQMKKNLQIAQRNAGQPASYDFTVLLSEFGSAWSTIDPTRLPKIVSIEYKDRALLIQVNGSMPQEELKKALSAKGLILKKNNAEVWQVKEDT